MVKIVIITITIFVVVSCCTGESLHWRTLILGTHHCSSCLATGEFPLSCSLFHSLSCSLLSHSCSLSFIFPKWNFQHWSRCMSSAMGRAHTSACMGTCLILPWVTNTHAINHGHVSPISGCISLESMAEKSQASTSLTKYYDLSALEGEYGRFYYATDHADFQSVNQSHLVSTKFS